MAYLRCSWSRSNLVYDEKQETRGQETQWEERVVGGHTTGGDSQENQGPTESFTSFG